ncbi:MAG: hypothetical protein ACOYMV_12825 [Verrucomicrobiia bacterium]
MKITFDFESPDEAVRLLDAVLRVDRQSPLGLSTGCTPEGSYRQVIDRLRDAGFRERCRPFLNQAVPPSADHPSFKGFTASEVIAYDILRVLAHPATAAV